ncbi:hypothetical protein DHB74_04445 [Pseudomonas sp. G11-1]|nr:hypothetical protein [Pseudomonas sp. G11-1]MCO5788295.1 hypothetical protein [Pseudomonas sp. G11-2]
MNRNKRSLPSASGLRMSAIGIASVMLAGCFSGSGSSDSRSDELSEGVFIDSAVSGLRFSTETQQGRTSAEGAFVYRPGENIDFAVGGIQLGSAAGQSVITPINLLPDADPADAAVVNMARLLQSLDADGNLVNGIQISDGIDQQVTEYAQQHRLENLDFSDDEAFEQAVAGLLDELNQAGVFDENSRAGERSLRARLPAWQHLQDSLAQLDGAELQHDRLPVLFIHGGAGSASQFESQAQRLRANGYPLAHIGVYEYNTATGQDPFDPEQAAARNASINRIIDQLLLATGAQQVNLIGHSMGTRVSLVYLSEPANAAKVARYVSVDGAAVDHQPGDVPTLALWGQYVDRTVVGAQNVYPPADAPVGHIEVATSAESFERMYHFFNGEAPAETAIPQAAGQQVWIAGKTHIFPENIGAEGTTLEIYQTDPHTGVRLSDVPLHTQRIGVSGDWGPLQVDRDAVLEYALLHPEPGNDQYFYREGYPQDSFLVRLNTSLPGTGVGQYLHRSAAHTNIIIGRDKELWGDQGDDNDRLTVNGIDVVTELTAPLLKRLSSLFLHDRNSDQRSNLAEPDQLFHLLPFMSGLDLFLPASSHAGEIIAIRLQPRGGGEEQVINVPNWPSDKVRSVSVQFRDYATGTAQD